ncbi:hypothetical protein KIN20_001015 [Parelaphostrongylus tenuis]|uniref:Uncharacterized protein n=1 Tax=Parelaphostrongylus tenuis TaxID=148309 RepID=A0AAD5LT09_PARTN|nr:hypothetical protein KIN20_001015 [Parelaphostrongylus tenuis]
MANGATTKFGCAFYVCFDSLGPFVSYVCSYGTPHISVGVPLYTVGEPCSACGGTHDKRCLGGVVCNNTVL